MAARRARLRLISHERLALLMREKKMGPTRLARYCDLASHAHIVRLSKGQKQWVLPSTARLIAEALQVPVELLFEQEQGVMSNKVA
jgi:hypothetical protein